MSVNSKMHRKICHGCHSVGETAMTCYAVYCFVCNIGHTNRSTVGYFSMKI